MRPICLIAAGYASVFITWSATSVVVFTLIAAFLFFSSQKVKRWMTYSGVFFVTMTLNLVISIFRVMDRISLISWWIQSVLKKQVTLTGRIYIWDLCYKLIEKRPLIGYGIEADNIIYSTLGVYSAHNFYLDLMVKGGISAMVIYLLYSYAMGKKLVGCYDSSVRYIFLVVLAGLYVEFIAEACQYVLVYVIMVLAYHVDKFEAVPVQARRRVRLVIKRGRHVPNRKFYQKH